MPTSLIVPDHYKSARETFLKLAGQDGMHIVSHENDSSLGAQGELLFCDVAYFGNPNAQKTLILSSGTHGVEGYCGSAVQAGLMQSGLLKNLAENTQVILVHALNPFGFSYDRRVNEDNVDVNRNFHALNAPPPTSETYERFRKQLFPEIWHKANLNDILEKVSSYIKKNGPDKFQALFAEGQHQRPEDPYFGGDEKSWSRQIWESICEECAHQAEAITHIDIHTGLGRYGQADVIFAGAKTGSQITAAKSVFGDNDTTIPAVGASLSPSVVGQLGLALSRLSDNSVSIALEFGTVPIEEMFKLLIEDNWLYHNPDCKPAIQAAIRRRVKNGFCVNERTWLENVWLQSKMRVTQALDQMA